MPQITDYLNDESVCLGFIVFQFDVLSPVLMIYADLGLFRHQQKTNSHQLFRYFH